MEFRKVRTRLIERWVLLLAESSRVLPRPVPNISVVASFCSGIGDWKLFWKCEIVVKYFLSSSCPPLCSRCQKNQQAQ